MDPSNPDSSPRRFRFALSDSEKGYLLGLARLAIHDRLGPGRELALPEPPTERLKEQLGAFVCLKRGGSLRGCIGSVLGQGPLYQVVYAMAQSAAFDDPRFRPLTTEELDGLDIEISILSPLEPCPDPGLVEVGRHGLLVRQGHRQGLLLPQVATEWGWDRETFLGQTCSKAGLDKDCWRSPETEIHWFEAEVF